METGTVAFTGDSAWRQIPEQHYHLRRPEDLKCLYLPYLAALNLNHCRWF
jgi:hypothetical protein